MSDETVLIIELIKEQGEKTDVQIKAVLTNMDAGFDLFAKEMSKIAEQKKIQNGRVDKLEKITRINRFVSDNPKLTALMGIVAWFGAPQLIELIPLTDIIKRLF